MIRIVSYVYKYKKDVVDLILDIYDNELNFKGFERPDIYNIVDVYQKNEFSNFWIALDGEDLVGTVGLLKKTDDLAYLKRMTVQKEYRRRGLGASLLHKALDFAKKHGYKTVYAGTVKENPNAIKFYKKYGFVLSQVVPEDITAADNSICLELKL